MNILHALPRRSPSYGGPVEVVRQLAMVARAEGHSVQVLPLADQTPHEFGTTMWYRLSWPDLMAFKAGIPRADIIHVHGVWNLPGTTCSVLSRLSNRPYVVTPHGMLTRWSLRRSSGKKRLYSALVERRNLQEAAGIHYLNVGEYEEAKDYGLDRFACVIPNGVDSRLLRLTRSREALEARFPRSRGKLIVLFLGRLHHKKGLDYLIPAFAYSLRTHPRLHLLIAGPDEAGYGGLVRELLSAHSLDADVSVIGEVRGIEKAEVLAGADMFALTSREEGDPMAVKEAMAAGLPVIITPGCRLSEEDLGGGGMVVSPDREAIADALARLADDEAMRNDMGMAGRTRIAHHYTAETTGRQMLRWYRQVLEAWPAQAAAIPSR